MPPLRHDHFHPILTFLVKMVELPQQHANTTLSWLETLPLPIVSMSSVLNVAELLVCLSKHRHPRKLVRFYVKTNIFLLFQNVATFFSVTFDSMMKYF